MNINSISIIRAPYLHINSAPIHVAYIISMLREHGKKVYYADYLDTPFYIYENALKSIIIELSSDLATHKNKYLLPTELDILIERSILDEILNIRYFIDTVKIHDFISEDIVKELANILEHILNQLVYKARIGHSDAIIIIPPSTNTIYTLALINKIRERDNDIPIILMDYYNYDPSVPYFVFALTNKDFYNNDITDIISLDPEYKVLRGFIKTNVDVAVYGEGFDFIKHLSNNDVERRRNEGIKIFYSKVTKLCKDNITLPDFSDMTHIFESVQIEISRGCLYRCIFCERSPYNGNLRYYDLELFREIIQHILKYKKWKIIHIADTHINSNENIVRKYLEILKEENVPKIFAQIRPKKTSNEFFKLMADANIQEIGMGLESGSEKVLNDMRKFSSLKLIRELNKYLATYNFLTSYYIIIAFPTSTLKDEIKTIEFIEELTKVNENIIVIGSLYIPGYIQGLNPSLYKSYGIEVTSIREMFAHDVSRITASPFITYSLKMQKGMRRKEIIAALTNYHERLSNLGIQYYIPPPPKLK